MTLRSLLNKVPRVPKCLKHSSALTIFWIISFVQVKNVIAVIAKWWSWLFFYLSSQTLKAPNSACMNPTE